MRCVLAALGYAGILVMLPHTLRAAAQVHTDKGYDNVHPRVSLAKHTGGKGLIARLQAAHENSLETFQFFAAGICASAVTHVSPAERGLVCEVASLHLIARFLFLGLYMFQSEKRAWVAVLRSTAWIIANISSAYLMYSAADKYVQLYP